MNSMLVNCFGSQLEAGSPRLLNAGDAFQELGPAWGQLACVVPVTGQKKIAGLQPVIKQGSACASACAKKAIALINGRGL